MSITWFTVFVLLVGVVTYILLSRLIMPVRLVGTCVIMTVFAVIVENLETVAPQGNSSAAGRFQFFSDERILNTPNPNDDPGLITDFAFQSVSKEDHIFLDEILEKRNPVLKADLAVNTAQVRRAELVTHKETVRRAELVRSRQQ